MREIHQRILATLAIVTIIAILGVTAQQYTSLNWLVTRELRLREVVQSHSVVSWLIGFVVYTCLALIPGTPGKAVICGWLFGFWAGVLMVDGALTVAALITFLISRLLLRKSVESRLGIHLVRFRQKLESDHGFYLLMLRLLHAPFSLVNYLAGATDIVPIRTFWWTTQLGVLPGTLIFVFAGTRIPALASIAERGVFGLLDYPLLAVLATTSILPVVIKLLAAAIRHRLSVRNVDRKSGPTQPLSGATDVRR
jgi:uncharacterized membrane protein YdjX (TVP38/TMEM64 family)